MPTQTTVKLSATLPTFAEICRVYPCLRELADEAESHQENNSPVFCGNQQWYSYDRPRDSLRNRVIRVADAAVRRYGQQRVYDLVYSSIYDLIPDCRGRCGCYIPEERE